MKLFLEFICQQTNPYYYCWVAIMYCMHILLMHIYDLIFNNNVSRRLFPCVALIFRFFSHSLLWVTVLYIERYTDYICLSVPLGKYLWMEGGGTRSSVWVERSMFNDNIYERGGATPGRYIKLLYWIFFKLSICLSVPCHNRALGQQ